MIALRAGVIPHAILPREVILLALRCAIIEHRLRTIAVDTTLAPLVPLARLEVENACLGTNHLVAGGQAIVAPLIIERRKQRNAPVALNGDYLLWLLQLGFGAFHTLRLALGEYYKVGVGVLLIHTNPRALLVLAQYGQLLNAAVSSVPQLHFSRCAEEALRALLDVHHHIYIALADAAVQHLTALFVGDKVGQNILRNNLFNIAISDIQAYAFRFIALLHSDFATLSLLGRDTENLAQNSLNLLVLLALTATRLGQCARSQDDTSRAVEVAQFLE